MKGPTSDAVARERSANRKALMWGGLLLVLILYGINDLLGLIDGGGLFSVTRAIDSAAAAQRFIEVDSAGLRTIFIAGCALIVTSVAVAFNVPQKNRFASTALVMAIIGGGFVLDGIYGETIIGRWMADRGYGRCVARDRVAGAGKSRVWFDGFVRTMRDCPVAPHSIGAGSPPTPADPRTARPRPAKPVEAPGGWFSADDYPPEALRHEVSGVVWFGFTIGIDGHVSACTILRSSGSSLLDGATCGVYMARARYWPARDAAGHGIVSRGIEHVTWQIPKD